MSPIPSLRFRDPAFKLQIACSNMSNTVPPSSSDYIRHHTLPTAARQQSTFTPPLVATSTSGSSGHRRVPRASFSVGHRPSSAAGSALRARKHCSTGNSGGPSSGAGIISGSRRNRMLATLIEKARAIERRIPSVNDVSKIDKYSRVIFPSLFIVFNSCYWSFYLLQAQ